MHTKKEKFVPVRRPSAHDIYSQIKRNKQVAKDIPLEQMSMLEKVLPFKRFLDVVKWRKQEAETTEAVE